MKTIGEMVHKFEIIENIYTLALSDVTDAIKGQKVRYKTKNYLVIAYYPMTNARTVTLVLLDDHDEMITTDIEKVNVCEVEFIGKWK